jgi:hypothetical protein
MTDQVMLHQGLRMSLLVAGSGRCCHPLLKLHNSAMFKPLGTETRTHNHVHSKIIAGCSCLMRQCGEMLVKEKWSTESDGERKPWEEASKRGGFANQERNQES